MKEIFRHASRKNHPVSGRFGGLMIVLAFMLLAPSATAGLEVDDTTIAQVVTIRLMEDEGVTVRKLEVTSRDGIVTLSGVVPNLIAKDRADKVVEAVKGVRSVVNNLSVQSTERPDKEILEDVKQALREDPAVDFSGLDPTVRDGTVFLDGKVDSWQEKQLCARIVKGVRGVTKLRNHLSVNFRTDRSDKKIEREIERRLEWDVKVDAGLVEVEVKDGKAVLSGSVGSALERSRAYEDAWVAGVQSVDIDNLEVNWSLRDKMRRSRKYRPLPPETVRKAVRDAFRYDSRVSRDEIDVSVTPQGLVTLTGEVENLKAKRAAGQDARNTAGVWDVKNHLKIKPAQMGPVSKPMPSYNAEMARRIRIALRRNPYLEQDEISVSFYDGGAEVTGQVDSFYKKMLAEDIASGIEGVVAVRNSLDVAERKTRKSDKQLKEDIRDQLWWSPFVDSDDIAVSVEDGVATLVGRVESLRDRRTATQNAYDAGALDVRNMLEIPGQPPE